MSTAEAPPVETLDPIAEQRQRADELEGRLATLRKREASASRRVAAIDERRANVAHELDRVRLERELGRTTGRAAQSALDVLHEETRKLAAERSELVRGGELRAPVIAEIEAELAEVRRARAVADIQPLLERERALWGQVGDEVISRLAELFDEIVASRTALEAARAALPADERAAISGVTPWVPDLRSLGVFALELAINPAKRSYHGAVGDPRVALIPDMTDRVHEAHLPDGVDLSSVWRWTP